MSHSVRTDSPRSRSYRRRIQLGVLAAATVTVFASSLWGDFVWIDRVEILEGGYRVTSGDDFQRLWGLTLDDYLERGEQRFVRHGGYWRPVYALSLSLDWLLWKDRAWCYHLENILWHFAVVGGLYLLGLRLFHHHKCGESVSFWSALIFAVHPLSVHSVTWISGRKDTMCAAFAIASVLAFARSMETTATIKRSAWRPFAWLSLSTGCLLLALGCKELALVVPLVVTLLVNPLASNIPTKTRRWPRGALVGLAALWLCAISVLAYRALVLGGIGLNTPYPADSFWNNVAMSATVMWQYVAKAFWPVWPSISDAWPIPQTVGTKEFLAIIGCVLIMVSIAIGYVRDAPFVLGLLWYATFMIPAMGFVPLRHFHAERYMYPALWGMGVMFVVLLFSFSRPKRTASLNVFALGGLVVVTLFLATVTTRANLFWRDEQTLFSHSVARHPRHVEARLGLAHRALEEREYRTCIAQSRKAIEYGSDPMYKIFWSPWIARTNLGLGLYYTAQLEEARAEFEQALKHRPDHARSHYHVALVAFAMGDLSEAERHYRSALRINPNDYQCQSNLAITLLYLGDARQCVDLLEPLVLRRPDEPLNLTNLASALLVLEKFDQALGHFQHLIALEPDQPLHRAKLAWCLWETRQHDEARRQLELVSRKIPNHSTVRFLRELFARESH